MKKDSQLTLSLKPSLFIFRKSRLEVFCKKGVFQKFQKIHRKEPVLEFLFNKVAGIQFATLLKKGFYYRCFPLNFAKFLRTIVSKNSSNGIFCIFVLWIIILVLSQSENQNILQRRIYGNSRSEVLCKKGVLENFSKLTGKHLRQSLFLTKVAGLRLFLIKKRLFF